MKGRAGAFFCSLVVSGDVGLNTTEGVGEQRGGEKVTGGEGGGWDLRPRRNSQSAQKRQTTSETL